jgi:hypothetical protein
MEDDTGRLGARPPDSGRDEGHALDAPLAERKFEDVDEFLEAYREQLKRDDQKLIRELERQYQQMGLSREVFEERLGQLQLGADFDYEIRDNIIEIYPAGGCATCEFVPIHYRTQLQEALRRAGFDYDVVVRTGGPYE